MKNLKRFICSLLILVLLAAAVAPVIKVHAAGENLVPNFSMETVASATAPTDWSTGGWGTNTTQYTYNTTGRTGSRSLSTNVTAYTSGDSKWFFTPVAVSASTSYTYSDYFMSNVSTRLVAQYQNSAGAYSYVDLATVPASAAWTQTAVTFTTPATAAKMTVFHLIEKVGSLTIDDASLAAYQPPVFTGIVPNDSVEQASTANPALPAEWANGSWGTNTAAFSYPNTGHTGSRSVMVTLTNYQSGDAKWFFNPVTTLTAGKDYTFKTWYKSSTAAQVVAMWYDAAGTVHYLNLAAPTAAVNPDTWQQYQSVFNVPTSAVSVSVFMLIAGNGFLQTDDYSLTPFVVQGFNQPLVSLTFDDGWRSTYTNGLPILNKYGMVSTQYLISDTFGDSQYMTKDQVKAFMNQGSEIGSHTISHSDLTTLPPAQLDQELQQSQTTLRKYFGPTVAVNFATPYGSYNDAVITNIKKYYRSHRSTDAGYNNKTTFDIYNIKVQNVEQDTTNAQVAAWVAQAKADKTWLVLVYHQVNKTYIPADDYSVLKSDLDIQLKNIKNSGVAVKTVNQALDEIQPQL